MDDFARHMLKAESFDDVNGRPASRPADLPYPEWKQAFDAWMKEVQARADRYPSGFVLDDSRESIYKGCGE